METLACDPFRNGLRQNDIEGDGLFEHEVDQDHERRFSTMDARPSGNNNCFSARTGHLTQNNRPSPHSSSENSSRYQQRNVVCAPSDDVPVNIVSDPSDYQSIRLSTTVNNMPSEAEAMDFSSGVDTNIPNEHNRNNDMDIRTGTNAETDPGFFVRGTISSGQYDNVPMEQENAVVYQDFGATSAKYVEPSTIRNARGYQGIKSTKASSTAHATNINLKMELKKFLSHNYDTTHKKRGRAIIINNIVYSDKIEHEPRSGSYRDTQKFIETFQELGLEPVNIRGTPPMLVHMDLSPTELRSLLKDASDPTLNDYTDCDCFIMVILSYGIEGAVLCADKLTDVFIEVTEIIESFKPDSCPSLTMKPKIFLFQLDPAITLEIADSCVEGDFPPPKCRKVPKEADILVLSCYMSSTYGWIDDDETGLAWFTRALIEGLKEYLIKPLKDNKPVLDFATILTRCNMLFARIMKSEGLTPDRQLGALQISSTFTKQLVFNRKLTDIVQ